MRSSEKARIKQAQEAVGEMIDDMPPGQRNAYRVSQKIGLNSAHLSVLMLHGQLNPKLERKLIGMGKLAPRPEPVEVEPCLTCGEVHTVDWCTHEEGEPRKPRKKKSTTKRKRRPRFSVAADDPEMAMAQLEKYYPGLFSLDGETQ